MSLSLISAAIWAILATIVALLPMRRQFVPGIILLFAVPVLLIYIGYQHGVWIAGLGLLAFLSMFRNPLRFLLCKAMRKATPLPKELRKEET